MDRIANLTSISLGLKNGVAITGGFDMPFSDGEVKKGTIVGGGGKWLNHNFNHFPPPPTMVPFFTSPSLNGISNPPVIATPFGTCGRSG
jgi:hypothetical protein